MMQTQPTEPLAYTIPQLCDAVGISRRHYFTLKAKGQGPTESRLGRRAVVTPPNATAWLKSREQVAA